MALKVYGVLLYNSRFSKKIKRYVGLYLSLIKLANKRKNRTQFKIIIKYTVPCIYNPIFEIVYSQLILIDAFCLLLNSWICNQPVVAGDG